MMREGSEVARCTVSRRMHGMGSKGAMRQKTERFNARIELLTTRFYLPKDTPGSPSSGAK